MRSLVAKRGQRRTHCWGLQFVGHRTETIALSAPRQGLLSSQNFVSRPKPYAPQHSKQEQRARTPPSSSRVGEETSRLWATRHRTVSSSTRFQMEEKQNAHLRPRHRPEQSEPREQRDHRRSGSRPHSTKGGRKRGERRRRKKEAPLPLFRLRLEKTMRVRRALSAKLPDFHF